MLSVAKQACSCARLPKSPLIFHCNTRSGRIRVLQWSTSVDVVGLGTVLDPWSPVELLPSEEPGSVCTGLCTVLMQSAPSAVGVEPLQSADAGGLPLGPAGEQPGVAAIEGWW